MYKIVLFYKYIKIENPELLKQEQVKLLRDLDVRGGRMIIAHEGINATFEAKEESIEKYIEAMKQDVRFQNIHWKISDGTELGDAFPKLSVKVRKEIVSLHLIDNEQDIDPNEITGTHLKPEELKLWYENGKEFYVVDMRNDYELASGKFEKTIFPGLKHFRDLKKKLTTISHLKNKTVLTVCTGGVRCEKASGYLKREGFQNVYQLDGGIVSYMKIFPGQDFKGSLYVFDKRLTMHFDNPENHEVIGVCAKCGIASERYVNCAYPECHAHFITCESCNTDSISSYCGNWCNIKNQLTKAESWFSK